MGYYNNNLLECIREVVEEPTESKYVKKVVGSVNRHIRGKRYAQFSADESACLVQQSNQSACTKSSETYEDITNRGPKDSTVDSGMITLNDEETPQKSQKKRLSFSPNNQVIEVDVERDHPNHHDMPEKCIAHITETPKPQKVNYRKTRTSTPEASNEVITYEVLQQVNLIRNHRFSREVVLDLTLDDRSLLPSPCTRSMDDKFVVNLYESRQSKRWKRRGICFPDGALQALISSPEMPEQSEQISSKTISSEPWPVEEELDDDAMFLKLKKERDAECVRMTQASNLLKIIRKSSRTEWSEKLLAEKILLETDEKYALLINKIRDLGYTEVVHPKPSHVATATLSNFEFILEPQQTRRSKFSDFYVISLSHGTELLMSEAVSPDEDNKLAFNERFTFPNLNSEFTITVKIFTIRLRTTGQTIFSVLGKKTKNLCPMSKIYYENVHTTEMTASAVLKTEFRCCGAFQLTKNDIDSTHFALSKIPADSHLIPDVTCTFKIDNLKIDSKASGFLTLGLPDKKNEVLFWERKWCVLNGTRLSIYNYPTQEDSGNPVLAIDLEYCLNPILKNCEGCPRRRNFLLNTEKPVAFDTKNAALRSKSDFVVQKYFFASDDSADFELWTSKLQSILDCLQNWRKLMFFDDYY